MYKRTKERTERMINKYFKKWHREIPINCKPFNGVVEISECPLCYFDYNFTCGKKYYVINGYILDNDGIAYGTYKRDKNSLNAGMYPEFPAYPIETFNELENNWFIVMEEN